MLYFMVMSNLVAYAIELRKLLQTNLMEQMTKLIENKCFENVLTTGNCLPLPEAINMYLTIIF